MSWKVAAKRFELAQTTFDHIHNVIEHMDGKASQILGAMAFLTAAAAAVFVRVSPASIPVEDTSRKLATALQSHAPSLVPDARAELARGGIRPRAAPPLGIRLRSKSPGVPHRPRPSRSLRRGHDASAVRK